MLDGLPGLWTKLYLVEDDRRLPDGQLRVEMVLKKQKEKIQIVDLLKDSFQAFARFREVRADVAFVILLGEREGDCGLPNASSTF